MSNPAWSTQQVDHDIYNESRWTREGRAGQAPASLAAQEPYGSAIAPQRGNHFDVQSDDASASSQQRVPGYMHASGQVIMVDSHDSGPDHVIRGSLDAPKPSYPSSDVQLKLKGGKATARSDPWQPYESAPRENYFLGFMPTQFYELRWAFMRYNPLTWTVGQKSFTWGEALIFTLILAQMVWVSFMWAFHPEFRVDVILTGRLASLALMTVFFLSLHSNTIMLLVFGLPFDRQLPWHKLMACVCIVNGTMHFLAFYVGGRAKSLSDPTRHHHVTVAINHAYGMEVTGWLLFAPIVGMSILGIPAIARRNFAGFYRTHVVFAFFAAVGAAFHGFGSALAAGYVPMSLPGGVFWLFDILIRFAFGTRLSAEKKAQLKLIADPAAPERTVVEVSVENKRKHYTAGQWVFICFPQLGVLHWHPFTISSASDDERFSIHMLCGSHWTGRVRELAEKGEPVKAYIEGPYGAPMIDVHGTRYKCFVVVSGGVGWTFVRSWKRQLIFDASRGRPVKSINCIAILKAADRHQLPEFSGWDVPGSDSPACADILTQEDVFLTGKRTTADGVTDKLTPASTPGVTITRGRPELSKLLARTARTAVAVGESRVAVMICGNQGIVERVLDTALKANTDQVTFDCHHEMFSF